MRAAEIRTLAERQMGNFLKAMPKNTGTLKRGPVVPDGNHGEPTLAEIGITKKQSATAQKLADIPEPEFRERIAVAKASGTRPSLEADYQIWFRLGSKTGVLEWGWRTGIVPPAHFRFGGKYVSRHAWNQLFKFPAVIGGTGFWRIPR